MKRSHLLASAASFALPIALNDEGQPPEWVKLLPYGEVVGRDGRRWQMPRESADAVIAASKARAAGEDIVFDYDHQTDRAPAVAGTAPASGWIKELQARDDGIYGRVEWTRPATAALQEQEYRYISPVFNFDKATGQVTRILRAGLTNTPNLVLGAVASEQEPGEETLDLKQIAQALGLAEDATLEQILEAIAAMKGAVNSELGKVATAAGLALNSSVDAIVAGVTSIKAKADTAGNGTDALVAVQSELNQLKGDLAKRDATAKVDQAIKDGKVVPAARDQFIALASENPARFDAIIGAQPVIVAPGGKGGATPPNADPNVLTDEEKAVCSATGISEADYLKQKKDAA